MTSSIFSRTLLKKKQKQILTLHLCMNRQDERMKRGKKHTSFKGFSTSRSDFRSYTSWLLENKIASVRLIVDHQLLRLMASSPLDGLCQTMHVWCWCSRLQETAREGLFYPVRWCLSHSWNLLLEQQKNSVNYTDSLQIQFKPFDEHNICTALYSFYFSILAQQVLDN